jgi:GNAT superfamily N-acetyltransferase
MRDAALGAARGAAQNTLHSAPQGTAHVAAHVAARNEREPKFSLGSGFMHWASSIVEPTSLPLSGYVWEEQGCLVGNLSLIPFYLHGRKCYLIANVAVHPDYRRRGIARALTSKALEHARARQASAAWLHVREENDPALRLYLSLGFVERARRTTWHSLAPGAEVFPTPFLPPISPVTVCPAEPRHWPQEQAWLRNIYPPEIAWHPPVNWWAVRPGLWGELYRLLIGMRVRNWVAQSGDTLLAGLVLQKIYPHADTLWLAAPAKVDGASVAYLLRTARQELAPQRPLTLDFPAGQFTQDIRAAGFEIRHTLIWMEAPLTGLGAVDR